MAAFDHKGGPGVEGLRTHVIQAWDDKDAFDSTLMCYEHWSHLIKRRRYALFKELYKTPYIAIWDRIAITLTPCSRYHGTP